MSNLLGSGAFGEVYEGCVKNVNNVVETKVAIKVRVYSLLSQLLLFQASLLTDSS